MSKDFLNDRIPKVPRSEIHKNEPLVTMDAEYLGGHHEISPDFIPVRLHVGDLAVIVEILLGKRSQVKWPAASVFDLAYRPTGPIYSAEARGEVTIQDLEVAALCEAEGAELQPAASFMLLEADGGVHDVRFGFRTADAARWFVEHGRRSLGLD